MADLQTFLKTAPKAITPEQQLPPKAPGLIDTVKNAVGGYFSGIGNTFSNNVKEGGQALSDSASGKTNPFAAGATIFKDTAGILASPINQAITPIANATGVSGGLNAIGQGFVNSPVGQATTDALSAHPDASGAAADIIQGAGDTMVAAGGAEAAQNIWDKAYGGNSTNAPAETVDSRTADATPAYSKKLVGDNVKTAEGDIQPRVNEGEGLTGKRTVTTSASEAASGKELANIPDYPDKGTALEKSQAVGKAISSEAENMRGGLAAEDQMNPLDTTKMQAGVQDMIRSHVTENLPNFYEKGFPNTAAGRYYQSVYDAADNFDGTRQGLLDLRQTIDAAYESARGKLAWGSDSSNALDEAHTQLRNSLNEELTNNAGTTDTKLAMEKQTNLYRAKDVLESKASAEAPSTIGRFFQNHPLLQRLATRDFMRLAATATGATILNQLINNALKGK